MLEQYRIYPAMLSLGAFTIAELVAASGVKASTVRSVVHRNKHLLEAIGRVPTGRRGGTWKRYRLTEEGVNRLREQLSSLDELGYTPVAEGSTEAAALPVALVAAEDILLDRYPRATSNEERSSLIRSARDLLGGARRTLTRLPTGHVHPDAPVHARMGRLLLRLAEAEQRPDDLHAAGAVWRAVSDALVREAPALAQLQDHHLAAGIRRRLAESPLAPHPDHAPLPSFVDREPIAVIGTTRVGLVTGAGFAELGHDVLCIDGDRARIESLKRGDMPIWEPSLLELARKHRDRLHFSPDVEDGLQHARLLFVAVDAAPTSSEEDYMPAVKELLDAVPASGHHALVMRSGVRVGFGDSVKRALRAKGKEKIQYVSCPALIEGGSAISDFLHPDRIVIGDGHGGWAGDAVEELYAPLAVPILRTDIASAEMVKLARDAFVATTFSFINEIANVCEEIGADIIEVAYGLRSDARIGNEFFQAGIGFGGSRLPRNVNALKQLAGSTGYHFQLLTSVVEVNKYQTRRVIGKLQKHLGSLVGMEIALLGLASEPNTDDMREAPSLALLARLLGEGVKVRAYDPVVGEEALEHVSGVTFARSPLDAVDGAHAVVLATGWREFAELDLRELASRMVGDLLLDGRNFLDPAAVRRSGLIYEGIGHAA